MEKKHTTASGEDYLEAILMLRQKLGTVRSVDVSHQLEVSKGQRQLRGDDFAARWISHHGG